MPPMPRLNQTRSLSVHDRRGHSVRARASVGWGLLCFILSQLVCCAVVELWRKDLYDPEFAARLATLRARMTEQPDRPLFLVLGSSRTLMSFRPEGLPPITSKSGE